MNMIYVALTYVILTYLQMALIFARLKNKDAVDVVLLLLAPITIWAVAVKLARYANGRR